MARWIVVLMVFMGVVAVKGRDEPPLVTPLPDGLIVRGGGEIAVREGEWTVLVVLQGRGTEYLQRLHTVLRSATTSFHSRLRASVGHFQPLWLKRLLLSVEMAAEEVALPGVTVGTSRGRRGLFDFGGTILNKLFGTVTEEEADDASSSASGG